MEDSLMTQKNEFLTKLKDLLKEYDVSIGFSVSDCSDTYGLSEECLKIEHGNLEEWASINGWWMDYSDLERL